MNFSRSDEQAIATKELYYHLEAQVSPITPEIPALVPAPIKVERVGFTRNASNTPYIVYVVNQRRCCTFVKRRFFVNLVQALMKLKYSIQDCIKSMVISPNFGLFVKVGEGQKYIPSTYLNKFFERHNTVALERTPTEQCDCNDLFDMCLHSIAKLLQPSVADHVEAMKLKARTSFPLSL